MGSFQEADAAPPQEWPPSHGGAPEHTAAEMSAVISALTHKSWWDRQQGAWMQHISTEGGCGLTVPLKTIIFIVLTTLGSPGLTLGHIA